MIAPSPLLRRLVALCCLGLSLVHVTSAAFLVFDLSRASCDCIQVNFYTQENMSVTGQTNPPVNVYYVSTPWLISYSELIIDFTTYDFNSESALTFLN